MSHAHRNWRRKWTWDAEAQAAKHDSGITVTFRSHPGGGWAGELVPETARFLGTLDPRRIARLMRESGDFAREFLDRDLAPEAPAREPQP